LISVDVTYTNEKKYARPHIYKSMPPLFQSFKVRNISDIERHMKWPAEAGKADIAITTVTTITLGRPKEA